jgi:hypothetical protein
MTQGTLFHLPDTPKTIRDKALAICEKEQEDPSRIVRQLRELGFRHRQRDPTCFQKLWELPELEKQDTKGAKILNAYFCTLYEFPDSQELLFLIGRIGNTLPLHYDPQGDK